MAKNQIKVRRPGLLGGKGYTSKPARERRKILRKCLEDEGFVTCQRALLAMQSWSSSGTWAPKKRKAVLSDLEWLSDQLPNEPTARAGERLRRSLSKGKTMSQALGSAKSRVGRITDPEKLAGTAMYFGGRVHREHRLSDAECKKALEVSDAAAKKLMGPSRRSKPPARKNAASVTNMFGESLSRYPRLEVVQLSATWDDPLWAGHFDNLVFEGPAKDVYGNRSSEKIRIWRSRMTVADGMPCDDLITVEAYRGGIWEKVDEYCPRSGREANPGVVEAGRSFRGLKAKLIR